MLCVAKETVREYTAATTAASVGVQTPLTIPPIRITGASYSHSW